MLRPGTSLGVAGKQDGEEECYTGEVSVKVTMEPFTSIAKASLQLRSDKRAPADELDRDRADARLGGARGRDRGAAIQTDGGRGRSRYRHIMGLFRAS
jgi:hypothetical protein